MFSRVSFVQFSEDGNRLFVLTPQQAVYVLSVARNETAASGESWTLI